MSGAAGASAGAAAAAGAAAVARAVKASGTLVRVHPREWRKIATRQENPVVVRSPKTFFRGYQYLTSYKGLAFFTRASEPISLPPGAEVVEAERIWIP